MSNMPHDNDLIGWFPNSHMHKESEDHEYHPTRLGSETRAMGSAPHIPPMNLKRMFQRGGTVDRALDLTRHTALPGWQHTRGRP